MSDDNDTVDVEHRVHYDPNGKIYLTEKGYIVGLELLVRDLKAENARLREALQEIRDEFAVLNGPSMIHIMHVLDAALGKE